MWKYSFWNLLGWLCGAVIFLSWFSVVLIGVVGIWEPLLRPYGWVACTAFVSTLPIAIIMFWFFDFARKAWERWYWSSIGRPRSD